MSNNLSKDRRDIFFLVLFLACSIFALAMSMWSELYWKMQPCKLCTMQRFPYFIVSGMCIFGLVTRYKRLSIRIAQFLFFAGFILAAYHAAIQFKIFPDPCKTPPKAISLEEFQKMLLTPPCSKVTWAIWGLPISVYNAIFFLVGSILPAFKKTNMLD